MAVTKMTIIIVIIAKARRTEIMNITRVSLENYSHVWYSAVSVGAHGIVAGDG